jgi:hypothetical protein
VLLQTRREAAVRAGAVETARRALGAERFDAAFAHGAAMTVEEIVDHALGALEHASP